MKYHEMSKNYFFRELECQMTKEEVAELCFKTVRTVTGQVGRPQQILAGIALLGIQSELKIKTST
ncbi:hypothetical protein [Vibrio cholerae]|uniref:hypothetical protein n=1 Tax=Vibrio cholerae TaxID=666 RepID=UPI000E0B4F58|nr:hypothetical protein [Vibrio cholerae]